MPNTITCKIALVVTNLRNYHFADDRAQHEIIAATGAYCDDASGLQRAFPCKYASDEYKRGYDIYKHDKHNLRPNHFHNMCQ